MDILKELEQNADKIYSIKCCKTENNSCETCKEYYGNLEWCPKSCADEIIEALNKIRDNKDIIDKIISKL